MRNRLRSLVALSLSFAMIQWGQLARAQQPPQEEQPILHGYQKAPRPISDILNARPTPLVQVSPNGKWLLCGNQDSDNISIFGIAPETGRLTFSGNTAEVGAPVCIVFGDAR